MEIERERFLGQVLTREPKNQRDMPMATSLKELQTRMGALELEVPQLRGLGFYAQSIERGSRSEKA